ncbi:MAG: hypothetical protein HLUCCO18_14065 [Rhodobacteraceae bacterium HLUCCO18]|nr:MAG: hypothetical protein HLUCCO18_14065 [Rhodobacteraceae bacterium HLUCCO18]
MKHRNLLLSASVAALVMAGSAASAQSMRFSDVDADGNGLLSYDELRSAFGTAAANRLWNRGGGDDLSVSDIRRLNASDDDDDDGSRDDNDDDDDGGSRDDNDDDDDGGSRDDNDDDDDDGGSGSSDDDDDDD